MQKGVPVKTHDRKDTGFFFAGLVVSWVVTELNACYNCNTAHLSC